MIKYYSRNTLVAFVAMLTLFFGFRATVMAQDAKKGEQLFKANCTSCHAVDSKVVGPALKDIHKRRDEAWLIKWIKNSTAVIKSGDPYAVKLFNEYNQSVMTSFESLSDADVKDILKYVKDYQPPAAAAGTDTGKDASAGKNTVPVNSIFYGLIALLGALFLVSSVLLIGVIVMINAIRAKNGQPGLSQDDVVAFLKNKWVAGIGTFAVLSVVGSVTVEKARSVGVHEKYMPPQPIAFSHKLHAGTYGVSCNYCHVGVEKGKSATIPSVNICMNCHVYVKKDSPEIQKLYKAKESGQPVEWVRIHNLPDLVYFNHAQHVKVGGQECQTCHGPVQEMEVVYQYSPLTMGWCIDCHRKTNVDVQKNDYYLKVHNEYVGKEQAVTVEKLGGTECAKCHY